jgi:hypothetical protein
MSAILERYPKIDAVLVDTSPQCALPHVGLRIFMSRLLDIGSLARTLRPFFGGTAFA